MSDTEGELREQLIRQPISAVLALFSFYFLAPYSGGDFWLLLAVHTVIATTLSLLILKPLTKKLFIFGDEMIGRAFMFMAFVGIANIGGIGQALTSPIQPLFQPLVPTIAAFQNNLTGAKASFADAGDGPLGLSDWLNDLGRRWNYAFADDGGWDSDPMPDATALTVIEARQVSLHAQDGKIYVALSIYNGSNVLLSSLTAEISNETLPATRLTFTAAREALVPRRTGEMLAELPAAVIAKAVNAYAYPNPLLTGGDTRVSLIGLESKSFDRQDYFERNVRSWLDS